jgi:DNA-binding SARP family transcriptional activator/class 3 adenylate cyclase
MNRLPCAVRADGDRDGNGTTLKGPMTAPGTSDQNGTELDLHVLGALAVLRNGERVALPPSRKTRALLAYLAVAGHPQRRERLCTMFWNAPDDPRGALRWSLSKIRQIVNIDGREVLTADRNEVALRSQSIGLDLRQVRAISQHHLPSFDISRLEQLAGLFKGGFLADLSLPRCPEYEAWRASMVNEIDLVKATVLRALIDRLAAEPARALPYAYALQAMDRENSVVATEVRALVASAREQAGKAPGPDTIRDEARRSAADDPRASAPATSPVVSDERKQVTVLSIEIVSPLHAFASVAPEVLLRKMDPLFESTLGLIELHGGIVSASGNTGITAVFGTSAGSGNHAVAACRVAMAVKSTIELQSGGNVRVRAGLDSGEAVVRSQRRGVTERIEVTGAAVRIAARLVHSLRRGILAVTDRTHAAVAGVMEMGALARSDCPRFGRDEQVYELLDERRDS